MLTTVGTWLSSLLTGSASALGGFFRSLGGVSIIWLVLAGIAGWYTFKLGNTYGSNARAYRAVITELKAKNAELEKLAKQDDTEVAKENAAIDAAHAKATKALGPGPKATKSQADLLNKIGE